MGVDYTAYSGFGIKLATEETFDSVIAEIEKVNEYYFNIKYSDKHIKLVVDSMCGQYIYLLYVLDSHDMYDASDGIELSLVEFKSLFDNVTPALLAAAKQLGLLNITEKDIKFITFTHAW